MKNKILTFMFIIYIFTFSILGIILKDKDISESERRKLSTLPEFTFSSEYVTKLDKYVLLGIGSNGHIGFNEPGTPFDIKTHIVTLKESTRKDNARFFNDNIDEVPPVIDIDADVPLMLNIA